MENLFTEQIVEATKKRELKIIGNKEKKLSKNQLAFNKLTKQIENANKKIELDKLKLETLLQEYSKSIPTLEQEYAKSQIAAAKNLANSKSVFKFTENQQISIKRAILWLCDQAFFFFLPDEETIAFYDSWSEQTYQEEINEQTDRMKQMFSDFFDMDLSDIDDTPEGFASFKQKIEEEFQKRQQEPKEYASSQQKNRKQLEKEAIKQHQETQKLKSIRSIYISLAKVLHPDTETDPVEKYRKEEILKKVISAYEDKDLSTLLKIEMEWVATEKNHLETLTDDKLAIYIASLKEQLKEIKNEQFMLYQNPRFSKIADFGRNTQAYGLICIKELEEEIKMQINLSEYSVAEVASAKSKKAVVDYLKKMFQEIEDERWLNFMDLGFQF